MKFFVLGLMFLGGVGTLLVISISHASVKAYKVHEILEVRPSGEECRVDNGKVKEILNPANPLRFTIVDDKDDDSVLTVTSPRNPPDNFKVGIQVGLRGVFLGSRGEFKADDISTKCPSKYEAESGDAAYSPPSSDGVQPASTPVPVKP